MSHVQRQLATFALALFATCSRAEEPPRPARFENAAEVAQLIRFPSAAKDNEIVTIRCGTNVSREGAISPVVYSNPADAEVLKPYEEEFVRVMRKLRAIPARANNRSVPVWLNFSIIFDSMHGNRQVKIVPNLQYDVKRYGEHYIDAQRIRYRRFPSACARRPPVWIMSKTDSGGAAQSASIILGTTTKSCERELMNVLLGSKFIPAQHEGKAVEGTYVEVWYTSS